MEAGEWHHIVAVFNRGYERIFVDGKARRGSIRADLSYLPAIVGLGKNIAAQIALGLLFIIPLSFLLTDVLPHRFRVFGPIVVAGLIISIQIVYHLQVDQSLSWATILISTLIALGSTWFASGSYGESGE